MNRKAKKGCRKDKTRAGVFLRICAFLVQHLVSSAKWVIVAALTVVISYYVTKWLQCHDATPKGKICAKKICANLNSSDAVNEKVLKSTSNEVEKRENGVEEKEVDGERFLSCLEKYTVENRFPGGRIFTYQYVTNVNGVRVKVVRTRAHSGFKPHDGLDGWGVVSNTYTLSRCVSDARDNYAHGSYMEAIRLSEEATNIFAKVLAESNYTNYIFEWSLINDLTFVSELFAERAIAEGRFAEAKRILKNCIDEYPVAPTRSAAIYFAADMLSGDRTWFFDQHVSLNVSNGVSRVLNRENRSYVRWEESFEFDVQGVNRQLALWGYIYPLLSVAGGTDFFEVRYSEMFGLPDTLPYPQLKRRWIVFGDYYGERWRGFGKYEEYNVSETLRENGKFVDRIVRDGVVH